MKKRNYLISLLAVVLSLGVLVGCGDKTNTSNEGASVNSSENSEATSSKDSADVANDKGEADKSQAKEDDSKAKEATNKDESEKKEDNSTKETAKVDNSNKKESKGSSNSSKKEEGKSASKKENSKDESSLEKAKSEYLQKMKKIDNESEKLDKEYETDEGSTQGGMNIISGKQAKLYDDELNEIYDYLKQNLSKEKAKELEKSEMAWIKEKESNIAEIRKQYEGGSITPLMVNSEVAKESKERCYYLIDNYMK
ncbi:lysozyme inhibitor LprI family protein [Clostridium perfringens]|uniref:lysozyme inhibitor LprI family protein n=1 Tax=Clostridium perfringens TaxID=1502 RepID=UPI0013E313B4|nr:lysozyme inhibitor LprI family protein [Clostridium perfringens]MDB2051910.1 lysozyme inhibitor LprI family protein [Clostridium perfringens]MDK0681917.1 lysozyme inhibitor LprI family protein [Clostridium perfringens]MDK0830110.1 lysozyme inhibitor LprI family protein [Clostridium perfringens]MDM0602077.1 lysozyme inhibitor LprI family protein [Clostridium perfringens]MDM0622138.1 lysozyme inhibitor LprI family protein [Clostridium perfringens]